MNGDGQASLCNMYAVGKAGLSTWLPRELTFAI